MSEIQVIGGGRMGEALVRGLIAAGGTAVEAIAIVEPDPARRSQLAVDVPGAEIVDAPLRSVPAVVAVKPHAVVDVCSDLASLGVSQVLSIAAGVTIDAMEAALGEGARVIRAMPNTPSLVGRGAAAIAPGSFAGGADLAWAESILGAVGIVVRVEEHQLDAVTGLSGSGPAYVFLLAEAMTDAGVEQGLPRDLASRLAAATIAGAGELLVSGDAGPAELRGAVTSPGGTTAAGIRALESGAVRAAVAAAVEAATLRSRSLG